MKKVSTRLGILIIVAAAIILLGGAFGYEYFQKSQTLMTNVQSNPNIQNAQKQIQSSNIELAGWLSDKGSGYEFKAPKDFFNFDRYSTSNPGTSYAFSSNYDFSQKCPNAKDALNNLLNGEGLLNASTYYPKESDVTIYKMSLDNNNICVYQYENDNGGNFCQIFIAFIKNGQRIIVPRLINNGCTEENINIFQKVISTFKFTK